jgi:hypothetical protein
MTEFHPVQTNDFVRPGLRPAVPASVALRAYEVYCHVYGPQPAMVDLAGRQCRGGFGIGELLAFLYAHSFPKEEWEARVREAFERPKDEPRWKGNL